MLTPAEEEREREESRRKAQLDFNTGMKVARMEGRVLGEQIGIIHHCERLLNRPETPAGHLMSLTMEALSRLADDLHAQVLQQR